MQRALRAPLAAGPAHHPVDFPAGTPPWWGAGAPPGWVRPGTCPGPSRPQAALLTPSPSSQADPTITLKFPGPYAPDPCAPGCLIQAAGPGIIVPGSWAPAGTDGTFTFTLHVRAHRSPCSCSVLTLTLQVHAKLT